MLTIDSLSLSSVTSTPPSGARSPMEVRYMNLSSLQIIDGDCKNVLDFPTLDFAFPNLNIILIKSADCRSVNGVGSASRKLL